MPADAVVGDRINDEQYKDFIEELAPGDSEPYSFSIPRKTAGRRHSRRLLVRSARAGREPGRPRRVRRRPGPHLPAPGPVGSAGPAADGGGDPAAPPADLHRRRVGRRPHRLDPDALPRRPAAFAGRLRRGLGRPDRHLGRRPGAGRRRTPARRGQPAAFAGAEPPGRPGRRRGRPVRRSVRVRLGHHRPTSPPTRRHRPQRPTPTAGARSTSTSSTRSCRRPPRPRRPGWPGSARRCVPRTRCWRCPTATSTWPPRRAHDPQVVARAHGPVRHQRCPASTAPPCRWSPRRAATSAPQGSGPPIRTRRSCSPTPMFADQPPSVASIDGRDGRGHARPALPRAVPARTSRTSSTAMRQRLLAEAAVRFLQPDAAPLTMVLPHDWNPSGGRVLLRRPRRRLARPHLGPGRRAAAVARAAGRRPRCATPPWQQDAELDAADFAAADALIRSGASLQNLLTLNNVVSGTVTDQALGSDVVLRARPSDRQPRLRRPVPGLDRVSGSRR